MTDRDRINTPGAPANTPHAPGQNAHITEGVPDGRTAREGAHRQTGDNTSPDPANEVTDPHPSDEEHPYDATAPGGDSGPPNSAAHGRADIGANPDAHSGAARPRPHNAGSGPE
jgi:hypothetical protein